MKLLDHISIDVTNLCSKKCHFCYNKSFPAGKTCWETEELSSFIEDCASHGVKAVSLGGGEPLEYNGTFEILERLRGMLFRTIITNGLLLYGAILKNLVTVCPDAVQISIHSPERMEEVNRVIRQVKIFEDYGIKSGINLLVSHSKLACSVMAAKKIRLSGIGNERIVYIPMRFYDTPSPDEVALVAGGEPFQSSRCLIKCNYSPSFCSIKWDKSVSLCSYAENRRKIKYLTYKGLLESLPFFPEAPARNTVMPTYPVAHSTDVIWFAIDADGHVGCFETGQNDYIPEKAYIIDREEASSYPLKYPSLRKNKKTGALIDLDGLIVPGFSPPLHLVKPDNTYERRNLFFLPSREILEKDFFKGYTITEFPSTSGIAISLKEPVTEKLWNILHGRELCMSCFADSPKSESLLQSKNGIFTYYNLTYDGGKEPFIYAYSDIDNTENRIYDLYSRVAVPERPASVEELSLSAPYLSETFRFTRLCFAESPHIHPRLEVFKYNKKDFDSWLKRETYSKARRIVNILSRWYIENAFWNAEKSEKKGDIEKTEYYLKKAIEFENMWNYYL